MQTAIQLGCENNFEDKENLLRRHQFDMANHLTNLHCKLKSIQGPNFLGCIRVHSNNMYVTIFDTFKPPPHPYDIYSFTYNTFSLKLLWFKH